MNEERRGRMMNEEKKLVNGEENDEWRGKMMNEEGTEEEK